MFDKKKKSNEWDYVKEEKAKQEKEEEYIVSSEKKFRARAIIITVVLCIGVVALGILYMNKIIDTSNAETVDNSAALDTKSSETDTSKTDVGNNSIEPVIITTTTGGEAALITTVSSDGAQTVSDINTETAEDFIATAFADENGLSVEWKYTNSEYDNQILSFFMTDGVTSYIMIGDKIPVTAKKFTSDAENTKNAVGLMIIMTDTNGGNTFDKTITVDNRTYQPETTYPDDIDPGVVIR